MRGCKPKKYLVAAAEVVELAHQMSTMGIHPVADIDWPALMGSKTAFTSAVPGRTEHDFQQAGIEMFHGTTQFLSSTEVMFVRAKHIVIATGARPAPLGFKGEDLVMTSEDFLELASVPPRVAFIGGGYISMEFAHVARAAGGEVTVLHRGDRVLKNFEPEVVDQLTDSARDAGIRIVTNFEVCGAQRLDGAKRGFYVAAARGSGHDRIASVQVKPALPHQSRNDYGLGVLAPDRAKARFLQSSRRRRDWSLSRCSPVWSQRGRGDQYFCAGDEIWFDQSRPQKSALGISDAHLRYKVYARLTPGRWAQRPNL
jgi:Pyridine nucleotide-disulphide oxidoreductase